MPNNYGSLLQSIATQHIIETLGHQCEIINYVRKDERGLQGILSSMVSKKEWNLVKEICIYYFALSR